MRAEAMVGQASLQAKQNSSCGIRDGQELASPVGYEMRAGRQVHFLAGRPLYRGVIACLSMRWGGMALVFIRSSSIRRVSHGGGLGMSGSKPHPDTLFFRIPFGF